MDLQESIKNQTQVAMTVSKSVLSSESKNSNVVFSPLSLNVALSLVAAGAKGATLDQMLGFLKSKSGDELNELSSHLLGVVIADGSAKGGPTLSVANGVWVDNSSTLDQSFRQVVENVYKASTNQADFQNKAEESRTAVNSWAEKETNGLVSEVLPSESVTNMTRLVLANAFYFKGVWNRKFDVSKTQEADFHLSNGSIRVPFITSQEKQLIHEFDGFKALSLPYKQGDDNKRQLSMYFLLPNEKDGLSELVQKIDSVPGLLDSRFSQQSEVFVNVGEFRIPKFKISFAVEASETLKELGLVLPFNDGDLSGMVGSGEQNLFMSGIFQKSVVEVNEEGTEAATTSGVVISTRTAPVDFVADHPFLFLIREDVSGAILFIGQVIDPSKTG